MHPATEANAFRGVTCCVLSKSDSAMSGNRPLRMVSVHGGNVLRLVTGLEPVISEDEDLEREKGIRWMPWHQEAMKDVARCEKPRGAASRL